MARTVGLHRWPPSRRAISPHLQEPYTVSRLFRAALAALSLAAVLGLPNPAYATVPTKVAIIVGPVGELTPTYLALAERAAATAEQHGATVARAYSPNATPANVPQLSPTRTSSSTLATATGIPARTAGSTPRARTAGASRGRPRAGRTTTAWTATSSTSARIGSLPMPVRPSAS